MSLVNKKFTWESSVIHFLPNGEMIAFGNGNYEFINSNIVKASFGYKVHHLHFNEDFTSFVSVRMNDLEIVKGVLINDDEIETIIIKAKEYINEFLLPIIRECGEKLEGNIFMRHHTETYTDLYINKIRNICKLVKDYNITNAMEIGFNAGFSTLLMLISNPTLRITCIDLGEHTYTMPCFLKIKETFGDRINIIIGDSTVILPTLRDKFELIHIDGGHTVDIARKDIINSYKLSNNGTIIIFDDYDFPHLKPLWDSYVKKYNMRRLELHPCQYHDIQICNE